MVSTWVTQTLLPTGLVFDSVDEIADWFKQDKPAD